MPLVILIGVCVVVGKLLGPGELGQFVALVVFYAIFIPYCHYKEK